MRAVFTQGLIQILLLCWLPFGQAKSPLTIAESSRFQATSRYEDVMAFIQTIQAQSPHIRVETMAISPEGRPVPLIVLGNPVPASPADLKSDHRAVVYIQANIHAGEVEGKEASLMLLRDILQQATPEYLDDLVILIAPLFNADGNQKISPSNRRNQHGPKQGVGERANGQGLDLNRDSIKLESPELRGLVKNVLIRWDPILLIDCHTTNGSQHEEPLTYSWQLNPNGDRALLDHIRDRMMPALQAWMKDKHKTLTIPYGRFRGKETVEDWATFDPSARYVTNYIGLRNRLAILIENYAYADYRIRVMANYHFLLAILDYCKSHASELVKLVREADRKTIQRGIRPAANDRFIVDYDNKSLKDPVTILSWEMKPNKKSSYPRFIRGGQKKTYRLKYYSDFTAKQSVRLPYAYLMPVTAPLATEKLIQHGIAVERLKKDVNLEVEAFQLTEIQSESIPYQGHRINLVKGEYKTVKKLFPKGCLCIRTAQSLGSLATYLLEAESGDGLLAWNFLDRYLVSQWQRELQEYVVYRLLNPVNLITETTWKP